MAKEKGKAIIEITELGDNVQVEGDFSEISRHAVITSLLDVINELGISLEEFLLHAVAHQKNNKGDE